MNDKSLFLKFKAFFIFALTAVFFLFYMKPVPDDGLVPLQTSKSLKVMCVKKGSEAAKQHIKPDFKILGVNHKLITSIKDVMPLIKYPYSEYLFQTPDGELLTAKLEVKKTRRITQPEIIFIFISLLLYILSITLILNNREIKELYYLHTAIFVTHFASLAFIVSPSYSWIESLTVLAVFFIFPFTPFILANFIKNKGYSRNRRKLLNIIPYAAIMFYLLYVKSNIISAIWLSSGTISAGYFYLAFIFKKKKGTFFFPQWFAFVSIVFALISLVFTLIAITGIVFFSIIKLIVAQQIVLNALILYNILKFGVGNKKLALKKSFVDAFIYLILLILYTFLIYFLNKAIGGKFIGENLKIYSIMLGILIVFILNPINEWIKDKLEFLLFKQERKLASKIFEMTDEMVSITDSEKIEKFLENIVFKHLKLDALIFCSYEKNFFKMINSHTIIEWNEKEIKTGDIKNTPFERFNKKGYKLIYPYCDKEEFKIIVLAKEPLTIQQKKILEHIFIQFGLSYQNIKLIEKAQKQIELERDMQIAGFIQKSLIPSDHPKGENFELYGISESAKTVGGDFFDYLPSKDNKIKAIIGDVAGKSVPAAIMMVSAKETLFSRSVNIHSPSILMNQSNKVLFERSNKNMFVACIYFVFNPENLTLKYINAGMPSPYLVRENSISILKKQKVRFPLALLPDVEYKEEELTLKKGDTLLFMTDGVTESLEDEIISVIEECGMLASAREISEHIIEEVKRKTGNILEDDATIVVLKIKE